MGLGLRLLSIVKRRLGLNAPQTARDDAPETAPDASRAWFFSSKYTHTYTKGRKSADKRTCRSDDTARARAKEQENQRTKERQRERVHTHTQTHLADATE